MRLRFFCLLFSGSCSRQYVFTSFWETKLKCSGGGGNQTTFFYLEYFGRLLSCNERSEISQQECVLWDAHLMKKCVQSKVCAYFTQDARQNESLSENMWYSKYEQNVFVKHNALDNGQFQQRPRSQGQIFWYQ